MRRVERLLLRVASPRWSGSSARAFRRETQLGGGGLGQSSRHVFFGLPEAEDIDEFIVYWPDGYRSTVKIDPEERVVTVRREAE